MDLLALLGLIVFMWIASIAGFLLVSRFMRASPASGVRSDSGRKEAYKLLRQPEARNQDLTDHATHEAGHR
jgi:hypothetical protein